MQDALLRVVMYAAFLLAGLALFGALLEWLEERKEAKRKIPETLHDEIAGIIILGVLNEGVTHMAEQSADAPRPAFQYKAWKEALEAYAASRGVTFTPYEKMNLIATGVRAQNEMPELWALADKAVSHGE